MFAHLRSHLALSHAVRTRKVKFKSIDTGVLDHTSQFLPTPLVVFLHDRSDHDIIWIVFFYLAELFEPNLNWAIGDQFDVFKPNHLTVVARTQLAIARDHIDYLARLETDSLRHSAAPAGIERLGQHARVRSRRARTEQEGVWELDTVDCN